MLCGIFHWSGHIQSDPFQRHGVSYFNSPICYTLLILSMDLVQLSLTFTPIVSWVRLREILTVLLSRATFVSSGNRIPRAVRHQPSNVKVHQEKSKGHELIAHDNNTILAPKLGRHSSSAPRLNETPNMYLLTSKFELTMEVCAKHDFN